MEISKNTLLTILDYEDSLLIHQELKLVSHENDQLILQESFDTIIKNVVSNLRVNSTERIIE